MSDRMQSRGYRAASSRSRSPARHDRGAHRTRSQHREHHRHKHSPARNEPPTELPYGSRQLNKRDYTVFNPMFALYLDIQKQKVLEDLDEVEAKGRWKSFIGKWNRGELAEGWYDPATLQKAITSSSESNNMSRDYSKSGRSSGRQKFDRGAERSVREVASDLASDSDDSVGPALPGKESRSRTSRKGPSIPNLEDLELQRELNNEDSLARRSDLQYARKLDRKSQKEALEELVPRADAGTRERRLEKRADLNAKLSSFRERSPGAAEVPETELLGGGDSVTEYKQAKQEFERKKNERELRKEEFLRARAAERAERLEEYRVKEEGTMEMLRALAKQNFG